jgi:hypothetical protein
MGLTFHILRGRVRLWGHRSRTGSGRAPPAPTRRVSGGRGTRSSCRCSAPYSCRQLWRFIRHLNLMMTPRGHNRDRDPSPAVTDRYPVS